MQKYFVLPHLFNQFIVPKQFFYLILNYRNQIKMDQISRLSMEIIAQESSRICSQNHLKDSESPSLELLMKAHDRIRSLQAQIEELTNQLIKRSQNQDKICQLQREVIRLNNYLQDRDLKIQNLERINQKAIMDYIIIEKQLNNLKAETFKTKKHVTPIPSQLNSPLNLSKINNRRNEEEPQESIEFERVNIECAKDFLVSQQKLMLNRKQSKQKNFQLFTFDKQNFQRSFKSPEVGKKVLKNCFSELEINNLIKKVNHREDRKAYENKEKIKHYHNYCSSVEKKYSPIKKVVQFPKSPPLVLKSPNPYLKNSKYLITHNQKPWTETSTSNGTTCGFGNINENSLKRMTFY